MVWLLRYTCTSSHRVIASGMVRHGGFMPSHRFTVSVIVCYGRIYAPSHSTTASVMVGLHRVTVSLTGMVGFMAKPQGHCQHSGRLWWVHTELHVHAHCQPNFVVMVGLRPKLQGHCQCSGGFMWTHRVTFKIILCMLYRNEILYHDVTVTSLG